MVRIRKVVHQTVVWLLLIPLYSAQRRDHDFCAYSDLNVDVREDIGPGVNGYVYFSYAHAEEKRYTEKWPKGIRAVTSEFLNGRCFVRFRTCAECSVHIEVLNEDSIGHYPCSEENMAIIRSSTAQHRTCSRRCATYFFVYSISYDNATIKHMFPAEMKKSPRDDITTYTSQTKDVNLYMCFNVHDIPTVNISYIVQRKNHVYNVVDYKPTTISSVDFPNRVFIEETFIYEVHLYGNGYSSPFYMVFDDWCTDSRSYFIFDIPGQDIPGQQYRPLIIVDSLRHVYFRFSFFAQANDLGFRARVGTGIVTMTPTDTSCGSNHLDTYGGVITLNFDFEGRRQYHDCVWVIRPHKSFSNTSLKMLSLTGVEYDAYLPMTLEVRNGMNSLSLPKTTYQITPQKFTLELSSGTGFYIRYMGYPQSAFKSVLSYTAYSSTSSSDCYRGSTFSCQNARCIEALLRCDGHDHCGDNSDEQNCGNTADEKSSGGVSIVSIVIPFIIIILLLVIIVMVVFGVRRCRRMNRENEQNAVPSISSNLSRHRVTRRSTIHVTVEEEEFLDAPPSYDDVINSPQPYFNMAFTWSSNIDTPNMLISPPSYSEAIQTSQAPWTTSESANSASTLYEDITPLYEDITPLYEDITPNLGDRQESRLELSRIEELPNQAHNTSSDSPNLQGDFVNTRPHQYSDTSAADFVTPRPVHHTAHSRKNDHSKSTITSPEVCANRQQVPKPSRQRSSSETGASFGGRQRRREQSNSNASENRNNLGDRQESPEQSNIEEEFPNQGHSSSSETNPSSGGRQRRRQQSPNMNNSNASEIRNPQSHERHQNNVHNTHSRPDVRSRSQNRQEYHSRLSASAPPVDGIDESVVAVPVVRLNRSSASHSEASVSYSANPREYTTLDSSPQVQLTLGSITEPEDVYV